MKFVLKPLCLLCVLCGASSCLSLDREAFSITNYILNLQIEPEQHRLGARGKITLRNDSPTPQKIAVLQVSSSLDWRSIRAAGDMVQFVTQPYTSDIDHTGSLSEAIITLPHDVAPKATIDLNIAYEGVILLDTTRLIRIGTPEDLAKDSDWDRIDKDFSAVRGAGYVAWYPIATSSASLAEEHELPETLARWKSRESTSEMKLLFESTTDQKILSTGTKNTFVTTAEEPAGPDTFSMIPLGDYVPTFVLADYKSINVKSISAVNFLPGKEAAAAIYADVLANTNPLPTLGAGGIQVAQLPESGAASFVSDGLLITPLQQLTEERRLTLIYALARQKTNSPHLWISEGLAHFAQVLDIEERHNRNAALDYLKAHGAMFVNEEAPSYNSDAVSADRSLTNRTDDLRQQFKAMCVWWMLRDMIGDAALKQAIASYKPGDDKDPAYMQRLISAQSQRDLQWFFDDWVYHDRGLPDFKIESGFASKTPTNGFLLTVTLDNLGTAGAEVPVNIKLASGEITKRVELRAKSKTTFRIETPAAPQEILVNDGSVPETNAGNNVFKVDPPKS